MLIHIRSIFIYTKSCDAAHGVTLTWIAHSVHQNACVLCAYVALFTKNKAGCSALRRHLKDALRRILRRQSTRFRAQGGNDKAKHAQGFVRKNRYAVYSCFAKYSNPDFRLIPYHLMQIVLRMYPINILGYTSTNTGTHNDKVKTLCLYTSPQNSFAVVSKTYSYARHE